MQCVNPLSVSMTPPLTRLPDKKFHVEHFTCSVCPTLFGPQDSYYEHDGDVFCHFHYSTRFATKCAGCGSAILKQFVEINRNMRDECWHPECYMINKVRAMLLKTVFLHLVSRNSTLSVSQQFWNVKVNVRRPNSIQPSTESLHASLAAATAGAGGEGGHPATGGEKGDQATQDEPPWSEEERRETASSLKEKQAKMEQQVYRIWT